jgi:hypothetical protein
MILATVNQSIRAYLSGAPAANQPIFVADWADLTVSAITPGAANGTLNGVTPVTIVVAPAGSTYRQVKGLSIFNNDTGPVMVTVEVLDTAAQRTVIRVTLEAKEQLFFEQGAGWTTLNAAGAPKTGGIVVRTAQLMKSPGTDAANLTAALTITTANTFYLYMGVCPRASSSILMRYRVSTAAVTVVWAETAVYRGTPVVGGNPALTLLGYADVAAVVTSLGQKSTTIALSIQAQAGDDLWLAIGNQATTPMQIRASLADDLQAGYLASGAFRPSTAGNHSPTLAGATVALPWFNAFVN